MATWLSTADLVPGLLTERQLVQLTQDTAGSSSVDETVLDAHLTAAEAEVEGYVGARFALPLASPLQILVSVAARIARYRLHSRRPGTITETLQRDYDGAVKLLRDIATGIVTVGTQPEPAANPERVVRVSARAPVFGRGNLDVF